MRIAYLIDDVARETARSLDQVCGEPARAAPDDTPPVEGRPVTLYLERRGGVLNRVQTERLV